MRICRLSWPPPPPPRPVVPTSWNFQSYFKMTLYIPLPNFVQIWSLTWPKRISGWMSGRITDSKMVGSLPKLFLFLMMTIWLFTPNFVQFWWLVWLNRISGRISGSRFYSEYHNDNFCQKLRGLHGIELQNAIALDAPVQVRKSLVRISIYLSKYPWDSE